MTREEAVKLIETTAKEAGLNVAIYKKYEFRKDDRYYYISHDGSVYIKTWENHDKEKYLLEFGNIYRTEPEAKKARRNICVWNKLRMFAEEMNGDWKPDWGNSFERKWFITFSHHAQKWVVTNRINCEDFCTIYFKTKKHAEQAIEEIVIPILGERKR